MLNGSRTDPPKRTLNRVFESFETHDGVLASISSSTYSTNPSCSRDTSESVLHRGTHTLLHYLTVLAPKPYLLSSLTVTLTPFLRVLFTDSASSLRAANIDDPRIFRDSMRDRMRALKRNASSVESDESYVPPSRPLTHTTKSGAGCRPHLRPLFPHHTKTRSGSPRNWTRRDCCRSMSLQPHISCVFQKQRHRC